MLVHATRPCFLAFVTEAVNFIFAIVMSHCNRLLSQSSLHIGSQGEFGVGWNMLSLFNFVNLTSHDSVDVLIGAGWELISRLSGEFGSNFGILVLLSAYTRLNTTGKLLRCRISNACLCLIHEHLGVCLTSFA